jgi:hypothetical protein
MVMSNEHLTIGDVAVVDDFDSGYSGVEVTKPALENDASLAIPTEDDSGESADETKVGVDGTSKVEAAVAPKVRQITEDEYTSLMGLKEDFNRVVNENKRQFDSVFGKIGSTEEVIRRIQATKPRGEPVKLTEDDIAEFRNDYPGMTPQLLNVLNTALSKVEGTAPASPMVDQETLVKLVSDGVAKVTPEIERQVYQSLETKRVAKAHPDFKQVFADPSFIEWRQLDPENRKDSWDSEDIIPMLAEYKASKIVKSEQPKPINSRKAELAAAVNPRGVVGTPTQKVVDDFDAGFAEG